MKVNLNKKGNKNIKIVSLFVKKSAVGCGNGRVLREILPAGKCPPNTAVGTVPTRIVLMPHGLLVAFRFFQCNLQKI